MDSPGTVRSTDPTARVHRHVTGPPQHQAADRANRLRPGARAYVSESSYPSDPESTAHLASSPPLEVSRSDLPRVFFLPPPKLRANSREKGSGVADGRPGVQDQGDNRGLESVDATRCLRQPSESRRNLPAVSSDSELKSQMRKAWMWYCRSCGFRLGIADGILAKIVPMGGLVLSF